MNLLKLDARIENLFAYAVALNQSGRMRSTIYCKDSTVYILNGDNTLLFRFDMSSSIKPFAYPFSFSAADYDSEILYEEDGKIVFVKKGAEVERKKVCGMANQYTIEDIENKYASYYQEAEIRGKVSLSKGSLGFFEESLSHIEFNCDSKGFRFTQRDVFSGTVINVEKVNVGLGMLGISDQKIPDFQPVGIRTNDFFALYSFADKVELS